MTIKEVDGRWLARKSPKAKTWEDITDLIKFDGDFASVMGKAGRTTFHAYLHKSGNRWLQMYGVTSLLGYWGEKDRLVQWAVDQAIDYVGKELLYSVYNEDGGYDEMGWEQTLKLSRTAHKRSLEAAGASGTDVHSECEEYIKKAIEHGGRLAGVIPSGSDQAQLFMKWAEENNVEFLASEKVVYSKRLFTAGTADIFAIWNGKRYLMDLKTSNWMSVKHFFQLGAYSLFDREMGSEPVEGVAIIHLPRGGGIKVVTNDEIGYSVGQLEQAFEHIVGLAKIDKNVSTALYN